MDEDVGFLFALKLLWAGCLLCSFSGKALTGRY
jgi:hypothetical protein